MPWTWHLPGSRQCHSLQIHRRLWLSRSEPAVRWLTFILFWFPSFGLNSSPAIPAAHAARVALLDSLGPLGIPASALN